MNVRHPFQMALGIALLSAGIAMYIVTMIYKEAAPVESVPAVKYVDVPYVCTASLTDLDTGETWEVPSPCKDLSDNICIATDGYGDTFRAWAEPCSETNACTETFISGSTTMCRLEVKP